MVEFLIRHGAVRSLGLQLQPDHWVQHVYSSDTLQHERSRPGDRNELIVSSAELQRQCIATLSAFALALPGNTELRVELMQCEQPLLFLAQFSQHTKVRAEARRALRRLQSSEVLPSPSNWDESNVFLWLSC